MELDFGLSVGLLPPSSSSLKQASRSVWRNETDGRTTDIKHDLSVCLSVCLSVLSVCLCSKDTKSEENTHIFTDWTGDRPWQSYQVGGLYFLPPSLFLTLCHLWSTVLVIFSVSVSSAPFLILLSDWRKFLSFSLALSLARLTTSLHCSFTVSQEDTTLDPSWFVQTDRLLL